jgi:hypothetical protein
VQTMSVSDQNKTELEALKRLAAQSSDLDQFEKAPPEFNVFEAMGVVFQEVRHSDFLAFLLDPQARHGLGDRFAKAWLKRVIGSVRGNAHEDDSEAASVSSLLLGRLDHMDISGARVYRERHRIDILLVDQTNRLVLIVENKIFSREHSDQLARYHRIVEERYPGYDLLCVFLTPSGGRLRTADTSSRTTRVSAR